VFGGACLTCAEESVAPSGKIQRGALRFEQGAWVFRDERGKNTELQEYSYIRFETKSAPISKAPIAHTVRLAGDQRVSGRLVRLDDKKATFITSWGKSTLFDRAALVGIDTANDSVQILHDDFEASLNAWIVEGNPRLSQERAFFGKSSLVLDAAKQRATRSWQTPPGDGGIRFYFHHTAAPANLRWSVEMLIEPRREHAATLLIDAEGCAGSRMNSTFGRLVWTSGWHVFSAERLHNRLRLFVDDHCLGETPLTAKEAVQGIRIAAESAPGKAPGKLWIDELSVTRRLPPLARPQPDKDNDMLWLEHGELLFGRIDGADAAGVTLDAKFGKRTLPWSKLRGIQFAQPKPHAPFSDPEITFRPCPGFPVDRLRVKLVRWENGNLIVTHALFGEIAIERERLDTIRIAAK